jgi:hypothetical protein
VVLIAGKAIDALLDEEHPELAFFAAWAVRARRGPKARAVVTRAGERAAARVVAGSSRASARRC